MRIDSTRPEIPLADYIERRARMLRALRGAAAVVLAGEGSSPLVGKWRPNSHFLYLTGLEFEPGASVLFDPQAPDPKQRCVLFLRPVNPEADRWDGYREIIGAQLKAATGFKSIMRASSLAGVLSGAARRAKKLACLHGFATNPNPVSPDLALFKQVTERIPGVTIEDRTQVLPEMRAIKSPRELALMRKAIAATAAGYAAALHALRAGATEEQLAQALSHTYGAHGAAGHAFNPIVGAGLHSTVLHHMRNDGVLEDGDLLLIDSGAEFGGYAADVTRTFPVSGQFSPEQREVYDVVLRAQNAAIKAARPGVRMWQVDEAARAVIEKAGFGDAFIHGIGHQLGLEVHDVTPDSALKAGMVVTIEPGVYLPERKLGVRIEDDVLITPRGAQLLTGAIPRTVAEIEAAMKCKMENAKCKMRPARP